MFESSILFPIVKLFELLGRENRFRESDSAANREDKASVQSEGADGIPNFWQKNCGRLPSSPPTASAAALDVPPGRCNFAQKTSPAVTLKAS